MFFCVFSPKIQKHIDPIFLSFFFNNKIREPMCFCVFFPKKINRDFIKGGHGVASFYEVISQNIFNFTNDSFP